MNIIHHNEFTGSTCLYLIYHNVQFMKTLSRVTEGCSVCVRVVCVFKSQDVNPVTSLSACQSALSGMTKGQFSESEKSCLGFLSSLFHFSCSFWWSIKSCGAEYIWNMELFRPPLRLKQILLLKKLLFHRSQGILKLLAMFILDISHVSSKIPFWRH